MEIFIASLLSERSVHNSHNNVIDNVTPDQINLVERDSKLRIFLTKYHC